MNSNRNLLKLSILKGIARENDALDEARAESGCSMGVGCETAGICYAEKMERPEMCGRINHIEKSDIYGMA